MVTRWSDTILRVAYTWTGSIEDAQDVCQTVLLKRLTHPDPFPEERLERAWILRVAINCCKDLKKSAWRRRRVPLEAAAGKAVHLPEPEDSPVLAAVQALPENYRQAVCLRYYEEYGPDLRKSGPHGARETRRSDGTAPLIFDAFVRALH